MLGSDMVVRALEALGLCQLDHNKLLGLTVAPPAHRSHVFHSLTFGKLSPAGKLSMFSLYLQLCVQTYALMYVKCKTSHF